jgi:hypothetical protein
MADEIKAQDCGIERGLLLVAPGAERSRKANLFKCRPWEQHLPGSLTTERKWLRKRSDLKVALKL